jgi:hypothetical protein
VPPSHISCGHGGGLRRGQIFAAAALVVVAVVLRGGGGDSGRGKPERAPFNSLKKVVNAI